MALSREEQEVVVLYRPWEDKTWVSCTYPPEARRLQKLGYEPVVSRIATAYKEVGEGKGAQQMPCEWDDVAWTFELPGSWYKGPRPPKQMGDAQREAAGERMRALQAAKKGEKNA